MKEVLAEKLKENEKNVIRQKVCSQVGASWK